MHVKSALSWQEYHLPKPMLLLLLGSVVGVLRSSLYNNQYITIINRIIFLDVRNERDS